ncbi:MAG: uroporphyrinogen-III synthase, partial [Candidatus Omnitrophica bacterium]|nr:uroporphyrinogen-III synthase [Candidatus Omnitrophota bacterium]
LQLQISEILKNESIDAVTFTSSSTAQNFFEAIDGAKLKTKFISIGPVTSKTVRHFHRPVHREARMSTIESLAGAVLEALR